jgi:hypothetical protein
MRRPTVFQPAGHSLDPPEMRAPFGPFKAEEKEGDPMAEKYVPRHPAAWARAHVAPKKRTGKGKKSKGGGGKKGGGGRGNAWRQYVGK